jgi:hypothetical protein
MQVACFWCVGGLQQQWLYCESPLPNRMIGR